MILKQLPLTVVYKYSEGKLQIVNELDRIKLENFLKNVSPDELLHVTYEHKSVDKPTVGQIKKVHACINEIAKFTGYDEKEIKAMVKLKAGLIKEDGEFKSFSKDCTYDELSLAIAKIIEIGNGVGFNLL